MRGPLIDGSFDKEGYVVCPWHGYRYNPKTGKAPKGAPEKVETYSVKVDGDDIYVSSEPISERKSEEEEMDFVPETPQRQDSENFVWKCFVCRDE
jgi:uncharacterized Zn finger protein (UPF0148 family)